MQHPTAPRTELVTAPDGSEIHVHVWPATAAERGVVHFLHGVGEHALRYVHLAQALTSHGFALYADDHLGHGATGTASGTLGKLPERQNRAAVDAAEAVSRFVRDRHPGLPFVLAGHSWGSLLAQQLLLRAPHRYQGVVLTGTALALPGYLNGGDLNKRFVGDETGLQWMSRDDDYRASFAADPLCFDIGAAPAWNLLGAAQLLSLPPAARRGRLDDVPVLIVVGSEDSLGFGGRGPRALASVYRRRAKLSDVTLRVYPGARHAVLDETNRDEIVAGILEWLEERFPVASGRLPRPVPRA